MGACMTDDDIAKARQEIAASPPMKEWDCDAYDRGDTTDLAKALVTVTTVDTLMAAMLLPRFKVWPVDGDGRWVRDRILLRTGSDPACQGDNDVQFAGSTPLEVAKAARARHPDHVGAVIVKNFDTDELNTVLVDGTVIAGAGDAAKTSGANE